MGIVMVLAMMGFDEQLQELSSFGPWLSQTLMKDRQG